MLPLDHLRHRLYCEYVQIDVILWKLHREKSRRLGALSRIGRRVSVGFFHVRGQWSMAGVGGQWSVESVGSGRPQISKDHFFIIVKVEAYVPQVRGQWSVAGVSGQWSVH